MSADISALITPLQPFAKALVDLGARAGVQPRVTSTLRSRTQQERLYAAYIRGESKYPVARPGQSAHEHGFAFDMIADSSENLADLGTVWRSWGGIWSPSDEVHFEYPGFRVSQLPEDLPTPAEQNSIQRVANAYNALPWYVTAFAPFSAATSSQSIQEASSGSLGARFLCSMGVESFC